VEYSKCLNTAHGDLILAYYDIPEPTQSNPNPYSDKDSLSSMIGHVRLWDKVCSELLNATAQISDQRLKAIIEELISVETEISGVQIASLNRAGFASLRDMAVKAKDTTSIAFQRIEGLLSGLESHSQ